MKNKDEKKIIVENFVYLVALCLYIVLSLINSSTVRLKIDLTLTSSILNYSVIILLIIKLIIQNTFMLKDVLIKSLIILVSLIPYRLYGIHLFLLALFIVSADHIDFEKIVKVSVISSAITIIIIMLLSQSGFIEDFVQFRNGKIRKAFGFMYVTVFASKVMYTIAGYIYLRKNKLTFWEFGGIVALLIFIDQFCDARLSVISIILLLIAYLSVRFASSLWSNRLLKFIVCNSYWIFAICITIISWQYNGVGLFAEINTLLSGRLRLGHSALLQYPVNLFGQRIIQYGNGGTQTRDITRQYFYIDSSYLRILLMYGIVVFLAFGLIFYFVFKRGFKEENLYLVAILLVIVSTGMVDENLLSPVNIFILALYAEINGHSKRYREKIKNG